MSYFKRIREIAAATIFGFVTMCSPAMYQAAHADLKGIELTSDTPLPMYHVSSSTLNLQSNTTLQGIPDLTQDLVSGNVYTCHAHLIGSSDTSTTIGGIKVAMGATNGLTASPVESSTIVYNSTAAVANNAATALGNMVSFTGRYTDVILDASFSVTHSGTIQLQAAQVASDVTITSVGQGSTFNCIHTPGTIAQVIQQGTPPMAAPFSGGASPNGNNYATGCNLGSCLVAEDVFQTTTLSTAWNPYFASGAETGTYTRNVDTGGLALAGTDSASYNTHCTGVSNATSPPYTSCGTGALSSSPLFYGNTIFTDTYFHFDTTHLFGDGFQWNFVATPSEAANATTCGTDTACAKGAVWKSGAISAATGCAAYGANCFVLPSTGGFIQIRGKMPDATAGTMPSIALLANSAGTAESGYEIDLHQGGFGYTTAANVAIPTNRVFTTAYRTQGAQLQTNNGFPYTYTLNAGTSYLDFTPSGGVPAVLQVGMNVFDISNPTNITNANAGFTNLACITNISAPFVQLGDCFGGDVTVSNTLGASTDDLKMGIGQVQNFSCVTNTTDGTLNMTPWDHESASTDGGNFSCARDMGVGNDLNLAYHIYAIEYIPNASITVYVDNVQVAKWSGQGIGSSAYNVVMYLDVANSTAANGSFHTPESWPTTVPPAAAPASAFTMQVNDIQLYKPPTSVVNSTTQAFVLNAPNQLGGNQTQLGNYATGCTPTAAATAVDATPTELKSATGQHTCLTNDEHWSGTGTSSGANLDMTKWSPGHSMCSNGTIAQFCFLYYTNIALDSINQPLSAWCLFGVCFNSTVTGYPYANVGTIPNLNLNGFAPLQKAGDGSLAFGLKFFWNHAGGNGNSAICGAQADCNNMNWVGSEITAGGITDTPNYWSGGGSNINNQNLLIPAAGGFMQFRAKFDDGLKYGVYPGMQCSVVGTIYPDAGNKNGDPDPNNIGANIVAGDSNANFEFGYLQNAVPPGGPVSTSSFGNGLNDVAVQTSTTLNGNNYVTTGDDGVGVGDAKNWHTYGIEWIRDTSTSGRWFYYVDGVSQQVLNHTESRIDSTLIGWTCNFEMNMTSGQINSQGVKTGNYGTFHSSWPMNADGSAQLPGPFYMYISGIQFWKKPGT